MNCLGAGCVRMGREVSDRQTESRCTKETLQVEGTSCTRTRGTGKLHGVGVYKQFCLVRGRMYIGAHCRRPHTPGLSCGYRYSEVSSLLL